MSSINHRTLGAADYQADLEVDFANEDQTGLIWAWLDHARGRGRGRSWCSADPARR